MPKKTIIITGTTSGIGAQLAVELAKEEHVIYMLVRNVAKGEKEKRNILVQALNSDVHVIECDLANLASVKKATEQIKSELSSIEVLINNAGGIFDKRQLSKDGYEMTFAVNHLGHFLLTLNLMPLLEKGKARIINVSSDAHKVAKPDMDDLQSESAYKAMKAYANAKLYNIYFAQALAEKYAGKGVTAYSLHPGVVNTKFGVGLNGFFKWVLDIIRPMMITPKEGAETPIYLANQPGIEQHTGKYFKKNKVSKPAAVANNADMRQQLWDKSLALVSPF